MALEKNDDIFDISERFDRLSSWDDINDNFTNRKR